MRVPGSEQGVIPGLYARGNASGGFLANGFPIGVVGVRHGRALTLGRIAGLNVAAEEPWD
jgi:fumarate reductase flavoprotein subunit